jgi:drug/metabolite transporter (DMT)-like permease
MPGNGGRPLGPVSQLPAFPTAIAGAACISSSAVVMQLAGSSASVTALGRCAFALPVLGALILFERRRGAAPLSSRSRWLARLAGIFLACDLVLWSHAISAIGAGLGTVVPNLQVLIIALIGWLVLGERPRRSMLFASPVMLAGLVLVGGLTGAHAYGADPAAGVAEGAGVAVLYSLYILLLRQSAAHPPITESPVMESPVTGSSVTESPVTESSVTESPVTGSPIVAPSVVAPLFEATLGAVAGSVVLGLALDDFRLGPAWPALGWLLLLALTSQVIGWLLITVSMTRLPAWMIGTALLVQPTGSIALGYLALDERPSATQLAGVALMLAGVLIAIGARAAKNEDHAPGRGVVDGDVTVEVAITGGDREALG